MSLLIPYSDILFDLDGTIIDPREGITGAAGFALEKLGIDLDDPASLDRFIGPPLHLSFEQFYDLSPDEVKTAVRYFREYFESRGLYEHEIYPRMREVLFQLVSHGKNIYLATSKPTVFARKILQHLGIDHHFTDIVGSNLDLTRSDKAEIISWVIRTHQLSHKKMKMVMIGDRKHDIIGAIKNGIESIGAAYGYGEEGELEAAGANKIIFKVEELEIR
jgi:phosphoglycolate phosphatase